jgi:isopentenyl phosphate kinase
VDDKELDNFIAKFKESRILQDTIVDALSEKTKIHNVKFLIDTYGVYIGAKRFW